jgi:PAS domain S-box-containing protein
MNKNSSPQPSAAANAVPDRIDELPLPYIEIDAKGIVTHANRATVALHPDGQGELIGKMAWDAMPPDEREQSCAAYLSLMESGEEPPVVTRTLFDCSGHFQNYELHRRLIRDSDDRPVGMRMVCVNVTKAKKELEEALRARQWLESVIASLSDAVIVTDSLGFIRTVNPATEAMFGWKAAELTGKLIEKALPVLSFVSGDTAKLNFTMSLAGHCRGTAMMLDRERRELRVEIGNSPILNQENGFTEGVVSVLRRLEDAT